ncbi:uncharacterized protein LOC114286935 [Camellia sinensis]|uniref:uncharacterized protein LOC114286935 n=1 Tax=Camellia sinensis TaxID=4442 RepID=UPI001036C6A5|nr:uncharacterized protein LOC114286935 [Camellia sinensis]
MVDIPLGVQMRPIIIKQKYALAYETIAAIEEVQDKILWYYDIWNFLEKETYPPEENSKDKWVSPKGSNGHEYILVAIDYFTKWVEAQSYDVLKAAHVAKFIRNNIIYQCGVPTEIISDNGSHFKKVVDLLEKYNVAFHKSLTYRPQTNGAVEAANKSIKNIL